MTAHDHAPQANAHTHAETDPTHSPTAYWEHRYSSRDRVWSGKVNATTAKIVGTLTPGRAIDLGCGEGGDVLWLAEQGWEAEGLDISPTAVGRARAEAERRGLTSATFTAVDLDEWQPEAGSVDLVTASFFQSSVALDRVAILRRAATALRPGGHLVVVSHAAPPSWAKDHPATMISVHEEVEQLAQPAEGWVVQLAEELTRAALAPDGSPGEHLDAVVVLARR